MSAPTSPGAAPEIVPEPSGMRTRRHTPPGLLAAPRARRLVRDLALLVGIFVVGYAIAFLWLAPAAMFAKDHAVPRVLELQLQEAERRLAQLKLRAHVQSERPHPTMVRGAVVSQDPPPSVILPEGRTVQLETSAGIAQTPVPDVLGLAAQQAIKVIQAAGLTAQIADSVGGSGEAGVVTATRPVAGVVREPGGTVGLVVTR